MQTADAAIARISEQIRSLIAQRHAEAKNARQRGDFRLSDELSADAARLKRSDDEVLIQIKRDWCLAVVSEWRAEQQVGRDSALKSFESAIALEQSFVRVLAMTNAGGLVALLAFSGNVWAMGGGISGIVSGMTCFAFGLLVTAFAMGASHMSQASYTNMLRARYTKNTSRHKSGDSWQWIARVLILISLFLIGGGMTKTKDALLHQSSPELVTQVQRPSPDKVGGSVRPPGPAKETIPDLGKLVSPPEPAKK